MNERAGVQDSETFEVADEDFFVHDAHEAIDADAQWIAEQCAGAAIDEADTGYLPY